MATVAWQYETNSSNKRMVHAKLTSCTSGLTWVTGLSLVEACFGSVGSTASTPTSLMLVESAGTITITYSGGSAGNDTIYVMAIGS